MSTLATRMDRFRSSMREFIDRHVIPEERPGLARNVSALDALCARLQEKSRALGVFAPDLWRQARELNASWQIRQVLLEEIGRSPLGAGAVNCAPPDLPNMDLLESLGTAEQKLKYLEPLQAGQCRSCFAMTEPAPGAGSDPSMIRTRATRKGSGWVIEGHKWFISGAVDARFAIVVAATDEGPTLFVVSTANPGWKLVRSLHSLDAFQMGGHGEIRLENCVVSDEDRLGEVGQALVYAQRRLEPARLAHCMRMTGRAGRVMDLAQDYVLKRQSFGSPLAELQAIQMMVADSSIDLHASRLMITDVAKRMDAGLSVKQESGMVKVFVSEAVCRVADRAVQLAGASGTLIDEPIAQFYEEVRPFRIYDGASEVHRAAIGKRVLKTHARSMTMDGAM